MKDVKGNSIFNLSKTTLTQEETFVLNKGLKCVPPKQMNRFNTFIDIHKYIRRINIQRYILSNPISVKTAVDIGHIRHSGLSNASVFNPPGTLSPSINVFRDLVLKDLEKLRITLPPIHYLIQA